MKKENHSQGYANIESGRLVGSNDLITSTSVKSRDSRTGSSPVHLPDNSPKQTPLFAKIRIEDINVGLSGELSHAFILVSDVKKALKRLMDFVDFREKESGCMDCVDTMLIQKKIKKIMGNELLE